MRKFVPVPPYSRVEFAAQGVDDLIVVSEAGLVTDDEMIVAACERHPNLSGEDVPTGGKKGGGVTGNDGDGATTTHQD